MTYKGHVDLLLLLLCDKERCSEDRELLTWLCGLFRVEAELLALQNEVRCWRTNQYHVIAFGKVSRVLELSPQLENDNVFVSCYSSLVLNYLAYMCTLPHVL